MEIKQLKIQEQAKRVLDFFFSGKAFSWELPEWQKVSIKKHLGSVLDSKGQARFWFFEKDQKVIAAGGVEAAETTGAFEISWLGVNQEYRRQGLGKQIILAAEVFVKSAKGRLITINTGGNNKEANQFYQALGYQQVGLVPDYYRKGSDKVTYYKKISDE